MSGSRRGIVLFVVAQLMVCTGCPGVGENSWAHYSGGGHFPAGSPSMSPDGSTIVFSSPRSGRGDIYQIDADGENRIRLTDSPLFETDPLYSPDGTTIAFSRESNGIRHIWLMNADGSNQRQLTSGKFLDDVGSFSPDGSELGIMRSPLSYGMGRAIGYFAVDLNTKKVRERDGFPQYSADGKLAVYSYYNPETDRYEIWVMDADGSNKRFVVTGSAAELSPDGHTVLFTAATMTTPGSLWETIAVDGTNRQEVGQLSGPVFTDDGQHLVCLSPEWRRKIWKMDVDGSNRERLPAPVGYVTGFHRCAEGFIFTLETGDRVGDVYVVDTDAWKVRKVAPIR